MPIHSLVLPKPIRRRKPAFSRDHGRCDRAIELFDGGDHEAAVRETLAYLLGSEQTVPSLSEQALELVQGTARVKIRIEDGKLLIQAAIAELTKQSHATAALRYFLGRVGGTGQLCQPRLRGKQLSLEFCEALPLLHPLKLIEALQRIASEAERHDSWLVDRFVVSMSERVELPALSVEEQENAWSLWETHWEAVNELISESRRRRSIRFLDALADFTIAEIRYTLPLCGALRARLNEAAGNFNDRESNPSRRDNALAKCARDMRKVSRDQLLVCLGHPEYSISPLREGSPSQISAVLAGDQRLQTLAELRSQGRSMDLVLELVADYLDLLAYQTWPEEIETMLRSGFDAISGRPWREASELLWAHANATIRKYGGQAQADAEPPMDATEPEYTYES